MKNKIIAALLAFVGGTFGIHKFYLRDPGAGVFYIFLTFMTSRFFPISTLLGFIDGLRYLMMRPEDFDRKFNQKFYAQRPRSSKRRQRRHDKEQEYYEVKNKRRTPLRRVRSNPFKKSGLQKYKDYDIEEAIEDFKKGLKIQPDDVALRFNLACAYSLLENKEEAFRYLDEAVRNGLTDYDKITSHDDLAFIRIQPEFDTFRKNGFKRSGSTPPKKSEAPMDDILLAQLNRLMELRKKGVLTENEYVVERKKILSR